MQNSSLHEFTLQVNIKISLNLKLKEKVLKQHLLFKLFSCLGHLLVEHLVKHFKY